MKILCLRHVAFEGPGIISEWADHHGYEMDVVRMWLEEALPRVDSLDALIIMGGPVSAYEDNKHPWLITEKKFITKAIDRNIPVLGICLGAQILADVLGAKVYPNEYKEIGWFPVELTKEGKSNALSVFLPDTFKTFQWHGDTFDLPDGAAHLLRSTACQHQAFVKGKVFGLQFHMEMTEEGIQELSERCAHELIEAPFIQTKQEICSYSDMEFNHRALFQILDQWIEI